MKRTNLLLLALLAISITVKAQWTTSGTNTILSNSGNLGLGTPDPITKIHLEENAFITFGSVYSTGNNPSGIQFLGYRDVIPSGATAAFFGASIEAEANWVCCSGYPALGGHPGVRMMDLAFKVKDNDWINRTSKITAMTIKSPTGNVGIGTTTPMDKLDVAGGIRLGNTTLNNAGTIRYTGTDFEGFTGGTWKSLTTPPLPSQWAGPTSGTLSTAGDVNVSISKNFLLGLPGTVFPPIFQVNSVDGGGVTTTVFKVDHSRIDATKTINITGAGTGLNVVRTGTLAGNAFSVNTTGIMTLNTTGVNNPAIGFFINSNNRNYFTINEQNILYKSATQDLFKVDANGNLYARKVIVTLTNPFPDYVFESNYKLKTLAELSTYIQKNKHLPNVPSAEEIAANKNQIDIGEMQVKLLEKVEELTLYILQQQKEIDALKAKLAD